MSTSLADKNRQVWNDLAAKIESGPPGAVILKINTIGSSAILGKYPFDPENTRLLDFACGTGLLTERLAPQSKDVVGADISDGMIDVFNARFKEIPNVRGVRIDLQGTEDEFEGTKFDVIVVGGGYHHFEDPLDMTRKLLTHLKPGGVLFVGSLTPPQPGDPSAHTVPQDALLHGHDMRETMKVPGFTEAEIRKILTDGGLVDFKFMQLATISEPKISLNIHPFLAYASKPE